MLSHFDLYFYAGGQLEFHESVHGLGVALLDVEKPAVRIELELLAGLLVDEGRAVDGEDLLVGVAFTVSTILAADLSTSM